MFRFEYSRCFVWQISQDVYYFYFLFIFFFFPAFASILSSSLLFHSLYITSNKERIGFFPQFEGPSGEKRWDIRLMRLVNTICHPRHVIYPSNSFFFFFFFLHTVCLCSSSLVQQTKFSPSFFFCRPGFWTLRPGRRKRAFHLEGGRTRIYRVHWWDWLDRRMGKDCDWLVAYGNRWKGWMHGRCWNWLVGELLVFFFLLLRGFLSSPPSSSSSFSSSFVHHSACFFLSFKKIFFFFLLSFFFILFLHIISISRSIHLS